MKYKVGDRVVIRKNLVSGRYYHYENSMGRLFFNSHMYKLCGKICVVTRITDLVLDEYFLSIDGEETPWYFNNAMLLPANSLRYLVMTREATSWKYMNFIKIYQADGSAIVKRQKSIHQASSNVKIWKECLSGKVGGGNDWS